MIKDYLNHEYREDIKNVFGAEPRNDAWFCFTHNYEKWPEIQAKNLALAKENSERHFVLSSVFLFHFAVTIAMWDVCSYDNLFNYDGFKEFYEDLTGWPQMDLTYWKEFTRRDFEEEFVPEDVVKILDRFGLMQNGIQNRSGEFMLSCIFAAMQGQLDKTLLEWNVSKKAKVAVSSKVQFLLDRIRDVLKTGYKPIGPEHENAEVESSASSEHKLELFFDEEFLEI